MASNTVISKKVFKNGVATSATSKMVESFQMFGSEIYLSLICSEIAQGPASDALVNSTSAYYEYAAGVSAGITRAAGFGLINEFDRLYNQRRLEYGQVVETPAFDLAPLHPRLFHVRSPKDSENIRHHGGSQIRLTWLTYTSLLEAAFLDRDLASLSLPLIGTGINGILIDESASDLVKAVHDFLAKARHNVHKRREIFLINNDMQKIALISDAIESTLEEIHAAEKPKPSSQKAPSVANEAARGSKQTESKNNDTACVICLEKLPSDRAMVKVLDKCQHEFCRDCIDEYFRSAKQACPICNTIYGVTQGPQPDGTMTHRVLRQNLPGFSKANTIEISYSIPDGVQGPKHPNPGRRFRGTYRTAYLPDNAEGREVLELLKKAFDQRHIFTVGQSRTTGASDTVTWNDVHHKTSIHGGETNFGYPDPTYLSRVKHELADKGIV